MHRSGSDFSVEPVRSAALAVFGLADANVAADRPVKSKTSAKRPWLSVWRNLDEFRFVMSR